MNRVKRELTLSQAGSELNAKRAPAVRSRRGLWKLAPVASIATLILAWEAINYFGPLDMTLFPPPSQFISYLVREDFSVGIGPERASMPVAILASFFRVLTGLAISFTVAIAFGCAISLSKTSDHIVMPVVRLLAPIAPIAWIPLGIMVFGIGNKTAVFIVFMGTVFILTIASVAAIRRVDSGLLKTAATLGADRGQQWRYVIVPAIIPQVFTLLRINFIAAWMAVLAAEMVGLRDGLGAVIMIGRESSNPNLILIGMCLIGVCGFLIDALLLQIQQRVLWWDGGIKE